MRKLVSLLARLRNAQTAKPNVVWEKINSENFNVGNFCVLFCFEENCLLRRYVQEIKWVGVKVFNHNKLSKIKLNCSKFNSSSNSKSFRKFQERPFQHETCLMLNIDSINQTQWDTYKTIPIKILIISFDLNKSLVMLLIWVEYYGSTKNTYPELEVHEFTVKKKQQTWPFPLNFCLFLLLL